MSDDKKKREEAVGEDALDVLLARWAEAEIEPPAGFHEQTMGRLREIQQQKKRNCPDTSCKEKKMDVSCSGGGAGVMLYSCGAGTIWSRYY